MLGQHKYAPNGYGAGRSIFTSSVIGLANTLAIVITFLGAPQLYGRTIEWVQAFTVNAYGRGWEDITAFCWFVVCLCLVFFVSRASISTALVMGGLAIANRVF
ncbi:MAG: hypothetical protein AAF668_06575 [Pseudomonadota bacterium]